MAKTERSRLSQQVRWLWLLYAAFIVYGTLIPFYRVAGLDTLDVIRANLSRTSWIPFLDSDGSRVAIPDVVQNILFFVPFGVLGYFSLRRPSLIQGIGIVGVGASLSFVVEALQLTTVNRITSVTDVATNTIGTAVGVIAAHAIRFGERRVPAKWRDELSENEYSFLFLVACVVIVLSALQPFDFSLDVGTLRWKMNYLYRQPLRFGTQIGDEAVVCFRYFLFGCISALFFRRYDSNSYPWFGIGVAILAAIALECCQIIVTSRMPNAQDVAVAAIGALTGGLFSMVPFRQISPAIWTMLVVFATTLSAGVQNLSPFKWATEYRQFNWFPFLMYYERTSFVSLSNFIESALIYFPLGVLLQLLYPMRRRVIPLAGILSGLIAFSLEATQGWIEGRYPDITDVLGAVAGGLIGSWIYWQYCEQRTAQDAAANHTKIA